METPDANGFVNVMWPSKNVPHGGIFHTRVVNPTTEQQNFLKVLMEESRIDTKLRHSSDYNLRRGRDSSPRSRKTDSAQELHSAIPRPHTSRRRSLSVIHQARLLDEDDYRPLQKGEDREKLKDKLADMMAYGDSPCQVVPPPLDGQKRQAKKKENRLPTEKEKWNDLVMQIRERTEWLAEMEYLGEGAKHREIINEQIAERMRAMDALGIDSQCSTTRSSDSGFSTTRSKELSATRAKPSSPKTKLVSGRSDTSKGSYASKGLNKSTAKKRIPKGPIIENVSAYNIFTPLGYSPRRRV